MRDEIGFAVEVDGDVVGWLGLEEWQEFADGWGEDEGC